MKAVFITSCLTPATPLEPAHGFKSGDIISCGTLREGKLYTPFGVFAVGTHIKLLEEDDAKQVSLAGPRTPSRNSCDDNRCNVHDAPVLHADDAEIEAGRRVLQDVQVPDSTGSCEKLYELQRTVRRLDRANANIDNCRRRLDEAHLEVARMFKLLEEECLRLYGCHQDDGGFMFGFCTRCRAFLG